MMKRLIFAILIIKIIISTSCSPAPIPVTPANVTTVLKFTGNGINYTINGSLADNSMEGSIIFNAGSVSNPIYFLKAEINKPGNPISIPIIPDSSLTLMLPISFIRSNIVSNLLVTNMSAPGFGNLPYVHVPNQTYDDGIDNDIFNLRILSVNNDYASGSFNATINDTHLNRTLIITNGEFTNVKISN